MIHYNYQIVWSEDDNEYVALCDEFPSLSYIAKTPKEALEGLLEIIEVEEIP